MTDSTPWKLELERSLRSSDQLSSEMFIPDFSEDAHKAYPLLIPKPFFQKADKGNPRDPLLLQVLPQEAELLDVQGFTQNPLREFPCSQSVIQKYDGRALLLASETCALHCRFCFRKYFRSPRDRNEPIEHLVSKITTLDPSCTEIILSGGDPLMRDDKELAILFSHLESFCQLKRIRIHSRLPVAIPQRVTENLIKLFRCDTKNKTPQRRLVLHLNHPAEIDGDFELAIAPLIEQGTPVSVQSVLLRGVNDSFETLFELYERLLDLRIQPYYLHQLDRVAGAAHFEVEESVGVALVKKLRESLPGYAVPRYVRETPGEKSKTVIE